MIKKYKIGVNFFKHYKSYNNVLKNLEAGLGFKQKASKFTFEALYILKL